MEEVWGTVGLYFIVQLLLKYIYIYINHWFKPFHIPENGESKLRRLELESWPDINLKALKR